MLTSLCTPLLYIMGYPSAAPSTIMRVCQHAPSRMPRAKCTHCVCIRAKYTHCVCIRAKYTHWRVSCKERNIRLRCSCSSSTMN